MSQLQLPDVVDAPAAAPLRAPAYGTSTMRERLIPQETAPVAAASDHNDNDVAFVCNICLEGVKDKDPVVTQCGHLYCWPCLYRWLNTRQCDGTCPICKAGVTQDNVIPIFIRGSSSDPRARTPIGVEGAGVPSRPQAHRPEPQDPHQAAHLGGPGGAFGPGFASGTGFFPSLFGLQFQSFAPPPAAANGSPGEEEEEEHRAYLSRVLLFLGIAVILCLLFF